MGHYAVLKLYDLHESDLLSLTKMKFKQVDVFTNKKYFGNPVAVFFDADNLNLDQMQTIARWTNLSETTFILKPTEKSADYNVRIFSGIEALAQVAVP